MSQYVRPTTEPIVKLGDNLVRIDFDLHEMGNLRTEGYGMNQYAHL